MAEDGEGAAALSRAEEDELEDLRNQYMRYYPNPKSPPKNSIMKETYSAFCSARIERYPILRAHVKKLLKDENTLREALWFLRELRQYELRPPGTGSRPPKKLLVLCYETRRGKHRVKRGELDRALEEDAEELLANLDDDDSVAECVDVTMDDPEVLSIGDEDEDEDGKGHKAGAKDYEVLSIGDEDDDEVETEDGQAQEVGAGAADDGEWEDYRKFEELEERERREKQRGSKEEEDDDGDGEDDVMVVEDSAQPEPSSPSSVATLSPISTRSSEHSPTGIPRASVQKAMDSHPPSSSSGPSSAHDGGAGRRVSAPSLPPPSASAMDEDAYWDRGGGQGHVMDMDTENEGNVEGEETEESEEEEEEASLSGQSGKGGGSAGVGDYRRGSGSQGPRPLLVDLTEDEEEERREEETKKRKAGGDEDGEGKDSAAKRSKVERETDKGKERREKGRGEPAVTMGLRYDRVLKRFVSVPMGGDMETDAAESDKKPTGVRDSWPGRGGGVGGAPPSLPPEPPKTTCTGAIDLTKDDD